MLVTGFLYFLVHGGTGPRLLLAGCYWALFVGAWVYKIAYRQGARDGVDELGRRVRSVPLTRPMTPMVDAAELRRKAAAALAELRRMRDAGELDNEEQRTLAAWERFAAERGEP